MVRTSLLHKRVASALLLSTIAVQLHVSGMWSILQDTPVFQPLLDVMSAQAQSTTETRTFGGSEPDTLRDQVNVLLAQQGKTQIREAINDTPATAQKVCQLLGYDSALTTSCDAASWGDGCGFDSCGNNFMGRWNASIDNIENINACTAGNRWMVRVTCQRTTTTTPPNNSCTQQQRYAAAVVRAVGVNGAIPGAVYLGGPESVIGAPNQFANDIGNGYIEVSFPQGVTIVDGPGADVRVHLIDFDLPENVETFQLFASNNGTQYVSLGTRSPSMPSNTGAPLPTYEDFDFAGRITNVTHLKIQATSSVRDGAEVDAFEALNANCPTQQPLPQCQDGIDNDGDGRIDLNDPGCNNNPNDNNEGDEEQCRDGRDNDNDGLTDFPNDPGCTSPTDNDEFNPPPAQCQDGRDNDGDGRTDFPNDPGCSSPTDTNEGNDPQCADRQDNDNDGKIDFPQDPGCTSLNDNDEFNPPPAQCQDGIDNDGDGRIDLQDPGCSGPTDTNEGDDPQCSDRRDNDGDGLTDYPSDPGCSSAQDNDERNPSNVTLTSVTANGCTTTVSYSKNFDTCAHLLVSGSGQPTHGQNIFCGRNGPVTVQTSSFNSLFQIGTSVKLCHGNNYNDCSAPITITGTTQCTPTVPQCRDGIDNDFDGRTDFPSDPGCSSPDDNNEGDEEQCRDGRDNDNDGLIDFPQDPGCTSPTDNDEFNAPLPQCRDGIDNDGDGRIDLQDPGCSSPDDNNEGDDPQCSDRRDNDNDGLIDFPFDPGCTSPTDNDEFNAPTTVDLTIQKIGPTSIVRGQTLFYSIQIGNSGSASATNVVVTDQIPSGLVYNDALSYAPCAQQGNAVLCTIGSLASNQFGQFTIAFDAPAQNSCQTTNVVNTISIGATQQDTNQSNNQSSFTTRIDCPAPAAQCRDGIDNDFDGRTDFPSDPGCSSPDDNNEGDEEQCRDGRDNDNDGLIDFPQDPGCTSPTDNDEFNAPLPQCRDGIDNDGDGRIDLQDPGCSSPDDNNEGDDPQCSDRRDNDGDGLTDWPADPGCTNPQDNDEFNAPLPQCRDGIDNDGDGRIDLQDPGCSHPDDNNEGDDPACSDRRDNDNDGLIDFPLDPGCSSPQDTDETDPFVPQCSDGRDNDFDGRVDMQDPGCSSPQDNDESDDPVQYGCIEILKETFDPHGNTLPITAQFTFILDATRVAYNDAQGRARFDQILPGQHSVAEIIPSGWTQLSITPQNGLVNVVPGPNCAAVVFKNRQVFVANAQCSDGHDNDGDGLKDYPQDPGCTSATDNDEFNNSFLPQCQDGIDNDNDGLRDYPQDPGCESATDNNEQNQQQQQSFACSDGLDNDGDGLRDYPQDPGCQSAQDTDEFNFRAPRCSDGIDNDNDGLIDYPQDQGCHTASDDNEWNDPFWIDRWREWWNWNW